MAVDVFSTKQSDLERLFEIINEPSVLEQMPLPKPVTLDRVRKWHAGAAQTGLLLFSIKTNKKIIGCINFTREGKLSIWLSAEFQRKGLGSQALALAEQHARAECLSRLWLECKRTNVAGQAFFEKNRFVLTGEKKGLLVYEKKL